MCVSKVEGNKEKKKSAQCCLIDPEPCTSPRPQITYTNMAVLNASDSHARLWFQAGDRLSRPMIYQLTEPSTDQRRHLEKPQPSPQCTNHYSALFLSAVDYSASQFTGSIILCPPQAEGCSVTSAGGWKVAAGQTNISLQSIMKGSTIYDKSLEGKSALYNKNTECHDRNYWAEANWIIRSALSFSMFTAQHPWYHNVSSQITNSALH